MPYAATEEENNDIAVTLNIFCRVSDEYTDWMTHNPLLQPDFDYLYRKYGGLIPRCSTNSRQETLLRATEAKHRSQVNNQLRWGYTQRTLDLVLVKLCMEARTH